MGSARSDSNRLTAAVIGAAISVHRELGPGLLESIYRACLTYELRRRGHAVAEELGIPVRYKGARLELSFRLDLVVDRTVLVELKSVQRLESVHEAQLLTYLRITKLPVGLLINFNVPLLKHGIRRRVWTSRV